MIVVRYYVFTVVQVSVHLSVHQLLVSDFKLEYFWGHFINSTELWPFVDIRSWFLFNAFEKK